MQYQTKIRIGPGFGLEILAEKFMDGPMLVVYARRILYFYSLAEKYGFKDPTSHTHGLDGSSN